MMESFLLSLREEAPPAPRWVAHSGGGRWDRWRRDGIRRCTRLKNALCSAPENEHRLSIVGVAMRLSMSACNTFPRILMSRVEIQKIRAIFPDVLTPVQSQIFDEIVEIVLRRSNYLTWEQKSLFFKRDALYRFHGEHQVKIREPRSLSDFLSAFRLSLSMQEDDLVPEMGEMLSFIPLKAEHEIELRAIQAEQWLKKLQHAVSEDDARSELPRLGLLLQNDGVHLQIAASSEEPFRASKQAELRRMIEAMRYHSQAYDVVTTQILWALHDYGMSSPERHLSFDDSNLEKILRFLLQDSRLLAQTMFWEDGRPVSCHEAPLAWRYRDEGGDEMAFDLVNAQEQVIEKARMIIPGKKTYLLADDGFHRVPFWPQNLSPTSLPWLVPKAALMSHAGYALLKKMGVPVPSAMAAKVERHAFQVEVKCSVHRSVYHHDALRVQASAVLKQSQESYLWREGKWEIVQSAKQTSDRIIESDDSLMKSAAPWLRELSLRPVRYRDVPYEEMRVTKSFPDQMVDWLSRRPSGIELLLDEQLDDLLHGSVSGSVSIEIEESGNGLDWFDINVQVRVSDPELTQEEIALLLRAKGKWVKLEAKGWRKLDYQWSEEMQRELAEIGLSAQDLQGEKQRMHALQLGALAKRQSSLLLEQDQQRLSRRIDEIQTRVTPAVPSSIAATLRPYQEEGFHFLAYLSTNQFGGVLADDMGLGKTLQSLTWLAWLREKHGAEKKSPPRPSLVIAPKSVQENWQTETQRFCSSLRCKVWRTGDTEEQLRPELFDILIVNYAQLRHWSDELKAIAWQAVIVDEAQNIKNPASQSTQCVRALVAEHRLALTGTPIENRLMDLWSIFSFAMPGVLGSRAAFTRRFDQSKDPQARKRLSALTRPFLMRRTKKEVAQDLPDRIEEDISVMLDGMQAKLYQAELKRARAHLLKAKLPGQLDQMRFHLLSSLLRLRQICCHPALLGASEPAPATSTPRKRAKKFAQKEVDPTESAKLDALMELLEPLIEEGQKVLVFSQFVGMLDLIQQELNKRSWQHFSLTGQTDNRGDLVEAFQQSEGAAVFLISLKAGGAGLNLTAASYVVLFDPWWNPAVEAQAIDRTHRIGQKSTVIAYRFVAKDTIEEKIRLLQQKKSEMAQDIFGEENFARALSLDDFHYLLADSSTGITQG